MMTRDSERRNEEGRTDRERDERSIEESREETTGEERVEMRGERGMERRERGESRERREDVKVMGEGAWKSYLPACRELGPKLPGISPP